MPFLSAGHLWLSGKQRAAGIPNPPSSQLFHIYSCCVCLLTARHRPVASIVHHQPIPQASPAARVCRRLPATLPPGRYSGAGGEATNANPLGSCKETHLTSPAEGDTQADAAALPQARKETFGKLAKEAGLKPGPVCMPRVSYTLTHTQVAPLPFSVMASRTQLCCGTGAPLFGWRFGILFVGSKPTHPKL